MDCRFYLLQFYFAAMASFGCLKRFLIFIVKEYGKIYIFYFFKNQSQINLLFTFFKEIFIIILEYHQFDVDYI